MIQVMAMGWFIIAFAIQLPEAGGPTSGQVGTDGGHGGNTGQRPRHTKSVAFELTDISQVRRPAAIQHRGHVNTALFIGGRQLAISIQCCAVLPQLAGADLRQ
tara:strand:- start:45685 stop:45993 length:309 start_codon:yes stop_codon:yes gene_type:complete